LLVTKVSGRRFARWDDVDIELPRTGVVLVTGKNGHGKSTIVEAVAQGVWGQNLRGQPGWRVGEKSGVEIEFDGGHVRRSVSKSKHVLTWQVGELGAAEFPTRTKSQAALDSHVGSFQVWRHACTFHTRDASRFTGATDAERKRLLEEVLELDRVEQGYRRARDEVKQAERNEERCGHALQRAEVERDGLVRTRGTLAAEIEEVPDLEAMRAEGRKLKAAAEAAEAQAKIAQDKHIAALTSARTVQAELNAARVALADFERLGPTCEACKQGIDPGHADRVRGEMVAEIERLEAARTEADEAAERSKLAAQSANETMGEARSAYQDNIAEGRAAVEAEKRNAARRAKLATIDAEIEKAEAAVDRAKLDLDAAVKLRVELEAAASVLSYQGARAAMLSAAVRGLEDLANDWLARLGLAGLRVKLDSQSEAKSGKVSDKISFEVKGAGGGLGYLAASTGEQRRIDIAVLLALGELAADSRGMSRESTLFVDELFDGLDDEGQEAVTVMLRELGEQRCVVVISHSAGLVHRLAPALHLIAKDGALSGNR